VAQKEVFHFQHTNYTLHPNVSCAMVGGVLVHFEPHFDGNSFKAIVSGGPGNRKWGPVITHVLVCTESMLKGGQVGEKCDLSTGSEVGETRRLEPTQYRVVRERRRTSAILRNRNIAKSHNNNQKKKVEENKQTKQKRQPVTNCEDGFRSCVSRVSSTYY
jgi:hypothetical protein